MNILDIVNEILDTPNTYLGVLPNKPDRLIGLFQYAGLPPSEYFGDTRYSYNVQARTRAKDSMEAYRMAVEIQDKLARYDDDTLSIYQETTILDIGVDDHNPPRHEYTVNFRVEMK